MDKIRSYLNLIFLAGTAASLIVYFTVEDRKVFLYVCGATIFFKLMEFVLRIMK